MDYLIKEFKAMNVFPVKINSLILMTLKTYELTHIGVEEYKYIPYHKRSCHTSDLKSHGLTYTGVKDYENKWKGPTLGARS